jgi:hypothetical protein
MNETNYLTKTKNYRQLTEGIKSRLNPDNFELKRSFATELYSIQYSEVLTYIRLAMKGVEPEYTQKSKDAGERVKEHLSSVLTNVKYRYQGSVMTDTHIKGHSDIDLLVICDKFYQYDSHRINQILNDASLKQGFMSTSISRMQSEVNKSNYTGDSLDDLRQLRIKSENVLRSKYSVCDTSKPKSIKIKNLDLKREVDTVIANWYDDVRSVINDRGEYRGIQVYDKDKDVQGDPDYPFLSIQRINDRSAETGGRLKKLIRFSKNCKANSDHNIDLSSFDINAICYDIDKAKYQNVSFYELVPVLYNQIKSICTNSTHADDVVSVDGKEPIFRYNLGKLENLKKLLAEIEAIFVDLKKIVRI